MNAPMLSPVVAVVQPTAIQKLQKIPPEFWWKVGLGVLVLVVIVVLLRKLAHVNKMILAVVVFITVSVVGFSWIYDRNEPAWATPVVEKLAPFFPEKDAYSIKQKKPLKP